MINLKQIYTTILIFLLFNLIFSTGLFIRTDQSFAREITPHKPEIFTTQEEELITEEKISSEEKGIHLKTEEVKKSKKWLWIIGGALAAGAAVAASGGGGGGENRTESKSSAPGGEDLPDTNDSSEVNVSW